MDSMSGVKCLRNWLGGHTHWLWSMAQSPDGHQYQVVSLRGLSSTCCLRVTVQAAENTFGQKSTELVMVAVFSAAGMLWDAGARKG